MQKTILIILLSWVGLIGAMHNERHSVMRTYPSLRGLKGVRCPSTRVHRDSHTTVERALHSCVSKYVLLSEKINTVEQRERLNSVRISDVMKKNQDFFFDLLCCNSNIKVLMDKVAKQVYNLTSLQKSVELNAARIQSTRKDVIYHADYIDEIFPYMFKNRELLQGAMADIHGAMIDIQMLYELLVRHGMPIHNGSRALLECKEDTKTEPFTF